MKLSFSEKREVLEHINRAEITILRDEPQKEDYEDFERFSRAVNRVEMRNDKVAEIFIDLRRQVLNNEMTAETAHSIVNKILDKYWGNHQ